MNISVIGCGRWGTFLAWYFNSIGYDVLLYGRSTSKKYNDLISERKNEYVELPPTISFTCSLNEAILFSKYIFIAISEQNLRDLMKDISTIDIGGNYILCMKGIEKGTGKRLSDVVYEYIGSTQRVAIMVGPAHPADIVNEIPTTMIVDSDNNELARQISVISRSKLIRFMVGDDVIGNEVGSALNKVVGIAGGILDGLGYSPLKGILMVKGLQEISKIIKAYGGKEKTAYGLCSLGEFYSSLFSEQSNSVSFGVSLAKNEPFYKHVPGIATAETIHQVSEQYTIDVPLLLRISKVITGNEAPYSIIEEILK